MRVATPYITLHGGEGGKNDPVLSIDASPLKYDPIVKEGSSRSSISGEWDTIFATGGSDGQVRGEYNYWTWRYRQ